MPKKILPDPLPIADILNFLFRYVRDENGDEFTNYEVAKAINLAPSSMGFIREGKTTNPGLDTIRKLCNFFGVPLNVFQCQRLDDVRNILEAHRESVRQDNDNSFVQEIMLRSSGLSDAGKQDILKLVNMVSQAEAYRREKISPQNSKQDNNEAPAG